jgi:hypothetical protein
MPEEVAFMFLTLFWAMLAVVIYQRVWTIRRLRKKLDKLTDAALAAQPAITRQPSTAGQADADELRRIQNRLQVLERIAVEKEDTLSREIEELRSAKA